MTSLYIACKYEEVTINNKIDRFILHKETFL